MISACREYVQTVSKTSSTLAYRTSELRFASCDTRTRACGVEIGEWVLFLKTRKVLVCELGEHAFEACQIIVAEGKGLI